MGDGEEQAEYRKNPLMRQFIVVYDDHLLAPMVGDSCEKMPVSTPGFTQPQHTQKLKAGRDRAEK